MQVTGADPVINAINAQGGVYMFGRILPIWAVILMCPAMSLLAACFYYPTTRALTWTHYWQIG